MTDIREARAVFERRVGAWLAEDLDAYVACWHDDMRIEMPSGVVQGAEKYRKLVAASFGWAAPVSFAVHHLAVDDDTGAVLADWTIRARRRADDVLVEWRGLSVCELRDGRITWWREHHLAPPAPVDERAVTELGGAGSPSRSGAHPTSRSRRGTGARRR